MLPSGLVIVWKNENLSLIAARGICVKPLPGAPYIAGRGVSQLAVFVWKFGCSLLESQRIFFSLTDQHYV
jgi:hypothetical protein